MRYESLPNFSVEETLKGVFSDNLCAAERVQYLYSVAYNFEITVAAGVLLDVLNGNNLELKYLTLEVVETFMQYREKNHRAQDFIDACQNIQENDGCIQNALETISEFKDKFIFS